MAQNVKKKLCTFDLQSIVTPVRADVLEQLLIQTGDNKERRNCVVNGFRFGFSLGYRGPTKVKLEGPNVKLRVGTPTELWNKIMKEVKLKRVAGPFESPLFKHYIQSPIGLVPKDGGKPHT